MSLMCKIRPHDVLIHVDCWLLRKRFCTRCFSFYNQHVLIFVAPVGSVGILIVWKCLVLRRDQMMKLSVELVLCTKKYSSNRILWEIKENIFVILIFFQLIWAESMTLALICWFWGGCIFRFFFSSVFGWNYHLFARSNFPNLMTFLTKFGINWCAHNFKAWKFCPSKLRWWENKICFVARFNDVRVIFPLHVADRSIADFFSLFFPHFVECLR